ncbi:methyltransferase domain-containing protein [Luteirhabdus pelagi]|uniref:methyltransferase domain-containing protein n=1 Tax=Luteirhabdus pelagi TaxID=2792783 RepID=UPI00193A1D8F|nr:methyltransferase domain-containing protein [Luteirhabdus pelagi]
MPKFSATSRSTEPEIMDSFSLQGKEMEQLLTDLKTVNSLLGGTAITLSGLSKLLKHHDNKRPITIIDFGCGDGEMLRQCAKFGQQNGYTFNLIGIDANPHILEEAKNRSDTYDNIQFQKKDVFSKKKELPECDVALCTLFLHHFAKDDIQYLLKKIAAITKAGIIINDLQRSSIAFQLFKLFGKTFLRTKIARHDGLVSIARGFTKNELEAMIETIPRTEVQIHWKWAFRFQAIIKTHASL